MVIQQLEAENEQLKASALETDKALKAANEALAKSRQKSESTTQKVQSRPSKPGRRPELTVVAPKQDESNDAINFDDDDDHLDTVDMDRQEGRSASQHISAPTQYQPSIKAVRSPH